MVVECAASISLWGAFGAGVVVGVVLILALAAVLWRPEDEL